LNFCFFIAKRYFFAKKSHNAINVISGISLAGVTVGTMALIIILSVFNGFDSLIRSLFNSFDPDIKLTLEEGKTFVPNDIILKKISQVNGVSCFAKVIEENALLQYGDKIYIATIKGVDENYKATSGVDSMIVDGSFTLQNKKEQFAVVGQGIAYYLQIGLKFINPLIVNIPRKSATISMNPENLYNHNYIYPSGVFAIEADQDSKFVIVPIKFAQNLLDDTLSISALEIKLKKTADTKKVQLSIQDLVGRKYKLQNRYEQKQVFYRIMKYEKWAIFMILTFILMIASFNIIGSLSMLIIEKKKDIGTLNSLGADRQLIRRIFLFEGTMISIFGAILGLIIGICICLLQIKYGFVKLQGSGSFIINSYPVSIKATDILLIFVTVLLIGYIAAWYPVRYIIKRYLL